MKIFSAAQIRQCDQQTIREEGIPSINLMERAAKSCLHWILQQYNREQPFLIICGMGNNGGDGLALTRMLLEEGYTASALILKHTEQFSPDASQNMKRLHQSAPQCISILKETDELNGISDELILIDAIFGTGINRPITGWVGNFIQIMNGLSNKKIALDIPSGLPADNLPYPNAIVFKVNQTLSFQFLKRSFLHAEGAALTGNISILDIGLSAHFRANVPSLYQIIDLAALKEIFQPRPSFSHKGDFGNALLVGGSYGMIGAIVLSTLAALKSGVGKVFCLAPECGFPIVQTLCPEAMFQKGGTDFIEKLEPADFSAIGIGPGLGQNALTKRAFSNFLKKTTQPLVLDADALNIIATQKDDLLNQIPAGSVLTPHPGEFKRLFGESVNTMERIETARSQAMKLNVTIVLKDHHTAVLTTDGNCFYNNTGNAGMAKGGSGDVLTGLITGLMAQGYTGKQAALLAVWLHGTAGDIAASSKSKTAMTARDICESLCDAFKKLEEA